MLDRGMLWVMLVPGWTGVFKYDCSWGAGREDQRKAVGRMTPMKWLKPREELESWCAQALR